MSLILHITRRESWTRARRLGAYLGDSLKSEGFIHASAPDQVVGVANARFRGQAGLVLLCIDAGRVRPEIRIEEAETGQRFPHIYGPLNLDAVVRVLEFPPGDDGRFSLPDEVAGLSGKNEPRP